MKNKKSKCLSLFKMLSNLAYIVFHVCICKVEPVVTIYQCNVLVFNHHFTGKLAFSSIGKIA